MYVCIYIYIYIYVQPILLDSRSGVLEEEPGTHRILAGGQALDNDNKTQQMKSTRVNYK